MLHTRSRLKFSKERTHPCNPPLGYTCRKMRLDMCHTCIHLHNPDYSTSPHKCYTNRENGHLRTTRTSNYHTPCKRATGRMHYHSTRCTRSSTLWKAGRVCHCHFQGSNTQDQSGSCLLPIAPRATRLQNRRSLSHCARHRTSRKCKLGNTLRHNSGNRTPRNRSTRTARRRTPCTCVCHTSCHRKDCQTTTRRCTSSQRGRQGPMWCIQHRNRSRILYDSM